MCSEVHLVCCSNIVRRKQCLVRATVTDMCRMSLGVCLDAQLRKYKIKLGGGDTPLVLKTEVNGSDFRASLGCRASTRTARSSQRNPVLKKKKKKQQQQTTQRSIKFIFSH